MSDGHSATTGEVPRHPPDVLLRDYRVQPVLPFGVGERLVLGSGIAFVIMSLIGQLALELVKQLLILTLAIPQRP
jgi:hypothetical protein